MDKADSKTAAKKEAPKKATKPREPRKERDISTYPEELQPLIIASRKAHEAVKQKRLEIIEKRKEARKHEAVAMFIIFRHIEKKIKAGDRQMLDLVNAAAAGIMPREGYEIEKVQKDRSAINTWLENVKR